MKIPYLRISVLSIILVSANVSAQLFGWPQSSIGRPSAEEMKKVQAGMGFQIASVQPSWTTAVKRASDLRKAKRYEEVAAIYKPALAELRAQEAKTDENQKRILEWHGLARAALLRDYGEVLNQLNRPEEALPLFQQLETIEKNLLEVNARREALLSGNESNKSSITAFDALGILQSVFSTAKISAGHMNRELFVYESANGSPYEELFSERLPETHVTSVSIADSYSRMGDRQSTLREFDGPFQVHMHRQREELNRESGANLDLIDEVACLRFALILSRVGPSEQQEKAFKCALELNFSNLRIWGTQSPVEFAQKGLASERRLFIGAFADQSLINLPTGLPTQRKLVEAIADSKGLGTRYSQWVRKTLFHSNNSKLKSLRPKLDELEKSRMNLQPFGPTAVKAMVDWQNSYAELMKEALPQLSAEGLSEVFIDGATVLKQAQQKLGDSALIGFSVYKPVDVKSLQLLPSRVLRYCITNSTVEVKDIGTLKEIEGIVFRWRSSVAAGGDTSSSLISKSLIGDLQDNVVKAKSWVIDPDGIISLVPFEALKLSSGESVLSGHSVLYVTSIAQFAKSSIEIASSNKSALVIANPTFDSNVRLQDSANLTRTVPTASGALIENLSFVQLPHTAVEASRVEAALNRLGLATDVRLGRDATIDALKFSSAPRYLHIATHGIYMAPGTDPYSNAFIRIATVIPGMQSALVFSPTSKGSIFTGADFARLALNGTELVVLSACDTGNGSVNVGEGIESLRMAVEAAGAKSSITSLWPVPSEATAELMGTFYEQLGQGVPKSDALRFAKLKLMKTRPEPINWAGFLLSGQP